MDYTVTSLDEIAPKVGAARAAFATGSTKPIAWRRATLERIRTLLEERESPLLDALAADFGKPRFEAWTTELGFTVSDINHTLAHLGSWMRPRKVGTPLAFQPGSSYVVAEPVGVVCVIAPWNYPVPVSYTHLTLPTTYSV